MIIQSRRNFIIGLTSLLAAPAIVRAGSLMKVKSVVLPDHKGQTWFKGVWYKNLAEFENKWQYGKFNNEWQWKAI